jgi:hypothetical protein
MQQQHLITRHLLLLFLTFFSFSLQGAEEPQKEEKNVLQLLNENSWLKEFYIPFSKIIFDIFTFSLFIILFADSTNEIYKLISNFIDFNFFLVYCLFFLLFFFLSINELEEWSKEDKKKSTELLEKKVKIAERNVQEKRIKAEKLIKLIKEIKAKIELERNKFVHDLKIEENLSKIEELKKLKNEKFMSIKEINESLEQMIRNEINKNSSEKEKNSSEKEMLERMLNQISIYKSSIREPSKNKEVRELNERDYNNVFNTVIDNMIELLKNK